MELGRGCKAMNERTIVDLESGTVLVINVPDVEVVPIVLSFILAIIFATVLFVGPLAKWSPLNSNSALVSEFEDAAASWSFNAEMLNLIMRDLGEKGLFKRDGKSLVVYPPQGFEGEVDVVMDSDLMTHRFFPDESYDFVFTPNFQDADSVDRIMKIDGIVVFPLSTDPSGFRNLPNYKVVFLKRYGSMVVALKKIGTAKANTVVEDSFSSSPKRKLFQLATDAKKNALKGLEDVLLEPPRNASAKSKKNLKIKYLPDLLGHSLEDYKNRVFVAAGMLEENKAAVQWFEQNYPKKSAKFEVHSLLVVPGAPPTDVSSWLSKHVKEEDYVVMKAEADVVEDMMKRNTMPLVDELFLECNNEWWQTKKARNSWRAYWQCLALYGRLRDEGVAVHQWWG